MNNIIRNNFQDHPFHFISPTASWFNSILSILAYKDSSNNFKGNFIPKPYSFINETSQSNLDLSNILTEVGALLPQLSEFITQFNNVVTQNGINVITDSQGNMNMDIPSNMPDSIAKNISTRLGIIDRLITTRGQEINELLQKGLQAENNLKIENPGYTSQLTEKINEFKRLNNLYKH